MLTRRGFAVGYPPVTCGDIPPYRGDSFCFPCKGRWRGSCPCQNSKRLADTRLRATGIYLIQPQARRP